MELWPPLQRTIYTGKWKWKKKITFWFVSLDGLPHSFQCLIYQNSRWFLVPRLFFCKVNRREGTGCIVLWYRNALLWIWYVACVNQGRSIKNQPIWLQYRIFAFFCFHLQFFLELMWYHGIAGHVFCKQLIRNIFVYSAVLFNISNHRTPWRACSCGCRNQCDGWI